MPMWMCTSSFSMWLCTRRILRFLNAYRIDGAAHQLEQESTAFFNLARLEYLVRRGQWDKVTRYVLWFMPPSLEHESPEATAFNRCVDIYRILGMVARGGQETKNVATMFPLLNDQDAKTDRFQAKYNASIQDILQRAPRHEKFWEQVRASAVKKLKEMALLCPEIKRKLHRPPDYAPKSWQINLSGVRPLPRPYKKKRLTESQVKHMTYLFDQKRHEIRARQEMEETNTSLPGGSI